MIILDENILDGQRLLLDASRLGARQIGVDIGRKGLKDEEIIVLLRRKPKTTFFTRDAGFYTPDLRHRSYCLVAMSVEQNEVATFIRRFLRHPDFDTQAKRMGGVIRVSHGSLASAVASRYSHRLEPAQGHARRVRPCFAFAIISICRHVSSGY